jgi:phosphoglycolate phosphatase
MRYRLIAFDLDGTLVDSVVSTESVLNAMRRERGHPSLAPRQCSAAMSSGAETLIRTALSDCSDDWTKDLAEFRARSLAEPLSPSLVFPGVMPLLTALQESRVPVAICTNKPRRLTEKLLDETGLGAMVTTFCAGDDPGLAPKPAPAQLASVAAKLGATAKTMAFIGDSDTDLRAARAFETDFFLSLSGYNLGCEDPAACCGCFQTFDELSHLLQIRC